VNHRVCWARSFSWTVDSVAPLFEGVSPRLLRHVPRPASQLSYTYLPDDFCCDAWRGTCLSRRGDKALGVAMTLGNLVGVVDTIAALKGGEGAWKKHMIPTALLIWVGPLGMFLSGLE
jgi:hypothetical protein